MKTIHVLRTNNNSPRIVIVTFKFMQYTSKAVTTIVRNVGLVLLNKMLLLSYLDI